MAIKDHLNSDAFKQEVARVLPKHCTPERMVRTGLTALMKTPKLATCTPESFLNCMLQLSQWGLEPDGRHAHLIPYGDQCTLILDYKGIVDLVLRSGSVRTIHADVVHEGDLFVYSLGEVKAHTPHFLRTDAAKPDKAGKIIAVYCHVVFNDGGIKSEVMSVEEVEKVRQSSRAGGSGPWKDWWSEMAKKGLAVTTPIPTPCGWKTMGDLQVGDSVFDLNGRQTDVIAVSEVKHLPCFEVEFADGEKIVCDDEHRWVARIDCGGHPEWPTYTINELFEAKQNGRRISMPVAKAIDGEERKLTIDPWVLGMWLGDGHSRGASITVGANDLDFVCEAVGNTDYKLGKVRQDNRTKASSVGIKKGLKDGLVQLNLWHNKHIPVEYLRSSAFQRLRLLQGLMDSDGHIEKHRGRAIFENTNKRIVDGLCEILASLGEKYFVKRNIRKGYGVECVTWRVEWQPVNCPVSNPRKVKRFRPRKILPYRGVKDIRKVESVPTKCIAVASETKTYLCGSSFVPTHNTVFRRASKWLKLSAEVADAFDKDDEQFRPARPAMQLSSLNEWQPSPVIDAPAIESEEI